MASISLQRLLSPLARPFYGGIGHILMFHRVVENKRAYRVPGAANIEYPPAALEKLLDDLRAAGYTFISMDELTGELTARGKAKKWIVITFDDGYADNFTTAYPVLKDRSIPFTIYLTTSFPDGKAVVWWYILEDMMNQDRRINFEFKETAYSFDTATPEGKLAFGSAVRRMMKNASATGLRSLTQQVFKSQGIDPLKKVREVSLSWEQLKALRDDPLATIGAHTVNHLLLKDLPEETARQEVAEGRARIHQKLGFHPDHFAFPYGGVNAAGQREFDLARDAGFKTAATTRMGNIFPEHSGFMYSLPRLDMGLFPDYASLKPALDGWVPARANHLKRVVTI